MIAALAANCAYAQEAQTPGPSRANRSPVAQSASAQPDLAAAVARPPAPPELAPLSQDFQAAMANSQLQTYRYNQLTDQALALKKLCDTGFGPADICPKAGAAAESTVATDAAIFPTVDEITGTGGHLSAVLVFADGRHLTVRSGSVLPNGLVVAAVTDDGVRVNKGPGSETVLAFGGGQAK
ncbi:MAG: hypothetical protein JWM91_396 [Rhodospirillales bacterium]|nr:hypothetical protein [Rhodospirillales bacterium]